MNENIFSIIPGKGITINGQKPKRVLSYSIYQDGRCIFPKINICYDGNVETKGILISEDSKIVRCSKCYNLLGYSYNGMFLKARCNNCGSKVKCLTNC